MPDFKEVTALKKKKRILITAILTVMVMCFETAMVSAASLSEIRKNIQQKQERAQRGRKGRAEPGRAGERAGDQHKQA